VARELVSYAPAPQATASVFHGAPQKYRRTPAACLGWDSEEVVHEHPVRKALAGD
jgi:hypothetical protein